MFQKSKYLKSIATVILHLAFWVGAYFFYNYFLGYGSSNTEYVNLFSTFLMPITVTTGYFVVYYLVPKYLLAQKHALFFLYGIYTLVISVYLIILSILYGVVFLSEFSTQAAAPLTKSLPLIIVAVFLVVSVMVLISLVFHHYNSNLKTESLQRKVLETELQLREQQLRFLKMQIHPHFLFNTLNTIYGFALKQSKDTPEVILKLSNLLDYILYQVKKPLVPLCEEIAHIEEYISLERIRFKDTLFVDFNKINISETLQVPPMLFIPFVENAFKHGNIINDSLTIYIAVEVIDGTLFFNIKNTVKKLENKKSTEGLGLDNLKSRLELLYPKRYLFNIENKNGWFEVNLSIRDLAKQSGGEEVKNYNSYESKKI